MSWRISMVGFFLILTFNFVSAQSFSFPVIKSSADSLQNFIPENWTAIDTAVGDLNGDNIPDYAFVLQYKDSVQEVRDTNRNISDLPAILIVLFKNKSGGYDLVAQNNTFMMRKGEIESYLDEDISISKKNFTVNFDLTYGYWRYNFRYIKKSICLINATSFGRNRRDGSFNQYDLDFIKKTVTHSTGKISDHNTVSGPVKKISLSQLRTLGELVYPYDVWKFLPKF